MCKVIWDIRQKDFLQSFTLLAKDYYFLHFCHCAVCHLDSGLLLEVSDGERRYRSKSYLN